MTAAGARPTASPAPAARAANDAAPPREIAVFRALVLGDLLCATPALRALRAAHPQARLTLVGLPWAEALAARLPSVDRFIAFPGWPSLPESTPDLAAIPGFLARMQAERFDWIVQLHGSGRVVNPLLATAAPRRLAAFHEVGGWVPEGGDALPWPAQGHEIERLLRLTDHLGCARQGMQLDFPLAAADRRALDALWPEAGRARLAVVHPGAQLASRRWPVERFARVADHLVRQGLVVAVTGTAGEARLAQALRAAMPATTRDRVHDLAGRTTLWTLGALVERAAVLVSNDTGVMHVAAALGTPSVAVSCGGDVSRWAPLEARRHRVLWQPMACRPCAHARCPYDHGCATAIGPERVIEELHHLFSTEAAVA